MSDRRAVATCFACVVACAGVLFSVITVAHPQTSRTGADESILEAVVLLFHGRYGEQPYRLVDTSSGAVGVEEIGDRSLRFVVRPVAGTSCVFRATFETVSGLNIEQIDFAKFDGSHQIEEACGEKGTPLESSCTAGLRFGQQPGSFCQYIFNSGNVSLENPSFPEGACRYLGYGLRERADLLKYAAAFDSVYKRCTTSIEPQARPERQPDK